jgi:hypothetical protein
MYKKIAALALAGTLTTFAAADEGGYKPLLGVELGAGKASFDWSYGNESDTDDTDWENVWGAKGGFYDENTRIYASFHYVDADEDSTKERWYELTANLEAKTSDYKVTENLATSFFIGGHVGGLQLKAEDKSFGFDEKETDLVYGVQGGVNFIFTPHFNAELGARSSWSPIEMEANGLKVELNYYYNVYVGFNYYF